MASQTSRTRSSHSEPENVLTPNALSRRVGAIFYDGASAERAIRDLVEHGFPLSRIRAVTLSSADTGVIADDFDTSSSPAVAAAHTQVRKENHADNGQKAKNVGGAVVGGAVGAAATFIAGFPTLGPILIGIVAGQLLASLSGEGFSDADAQKFERGLRAGGLLISVNAGARLPDAVDSLIRSGGYVGDGSLEGDTTHPIPAMPGNKNFRGA
jgi:hypothetical protein